jgi:uroporphyrinogen decarboxylase
MTPKERAIAALNLKIPDSVPTFELEFQLQEEMFGRKFIPTELEDQNIHKLGRKEKERLIFETAEFMTKAYSELEYSMIPCFGPGRNILRSENRVNEDFKLFLKYLKELAGDRMLLGIPDDGTFAIPDGNEMYNFAYAIADDPEGLKNKAETMAQAAIERHKQLHESG